MSASSALLPFRYFALSVGGAQTRRKRLSALPQVYTELVFLQ